MKKTASLLLLTVLIAAVVFTGCSLREPSTDTGTTPEEDQQSGAAALDEPEAASAPVTQAPAHFVFEDAAYESGNISIKYPQVIGLSDANLSEALNKIIARAALRDIETLSGVDVADYEVTYKVTCNSPELISVYFEGYSYFQGAAHPNAFLYAVTIDATEQQVVTLPALVQINDDFIKLLLDGEYRALGYDMTAEYAALLREYLESMGMGYWRDELSYADTPESSTVSYLTQDALVVSVSVPHVMGGHIEIILNYDDLTGYRTDHALWQQLEA